MDMRRLLTALALAAALGAAAACNNGSATPVTAPTAPATTDPPYSGTTGPGTSNVAIIMFNVTQAGEIDISLTAGATPGGLNIPLDIQIGAASGGSCGLQADLGVFQIGATTSTAITSQATGGLCLGVIDPFNLGPANYTILITHH